MFLNEHNLFEIYLKETENVIDKWVLCESSLTFTGKSKPFHFDEQLDRFKPWLDRIIRVRVEDNPSGLDPHQRDTWNRNCISRGLTDIKPDSVVILGDLDEIPRASAIADYRPEHGVCHFAMSQAYWYLNVIAPDITWINCRICPGSHILAGNSPFTIRHQKSNPIPNGGWHFSSTGGYDALKYKLESFAHASEPWHPQTLAWLKDGTLVHREHCVPIKVVDFDDSYPKYIRDNLPLMRERGLIYPPDKRDSKQS